MSEYEKSLERIQGQGVMVHRDCATSVGADAARVPAVQPTPGPWHEDRSPHSAVRTIRSADNMPIAELWCTGTRAHEANASIIAAAPDLLSALRFILAFYEPGQTYLDTEAWKRAEAQGRRAVAKAEGRS